MLIVGSRLINISTALSLDLKMIMPSKIHLRGLINLVRNFALPLRYYKPRIHRTVNKIIKCFTSCFLEIINILTKPIPKGFKI